MTPNNILGHGLALLRQATINQFLAVPMQLKPFGSSALFWDVSGSNPAVSINSLPVAPAGTRTIQPRESQSYVLAVAGEVETRQAHVFMDLSQCSIVENHIAAQLMEIFLTQTINADPRFTFPQSGPSVSIFPTRISCSLRLIYDDGSTFPPLLADVRATFGLKVATGTTIFDASLAAYNVAITVDPFPTPAFPEPAKEEEMARKLRENIGGLVEYGVLRFIQIPPNKKLQNVSVMAGGNLGRGLIRLTYCPTEGIIGPPDLNGLLG